LLCVGVLLAGACAGQSTNGSAPDPCPDLCEKGSKCPGAPPQTQSCDDTCLGQDFVAEATGCHDLYLTSIACSSKLKDVCTSLVACANEINAAHSCEVAYCNGHAGADVCAGVM
jgi:hypothetical protein